jgi:SAM-dependent methyltransferase
MTATEAPGGSTDALAERLFMAAIHTLEIASVHVGGRLGFYRALAEGGAATPTDLAARTGTAERYVREWLEQQAVAGFVDVDDPAADADARRYTLPDAHHPVFVDEESLSHLTGLAQLVVGVLRPIDELVEAYRSGAGVPYPAYGADTVEGIAATNRPQFHNLLANWFAAVPEIDARLRADPPDADSIQSTRRNVGAAGLADRVRPVIHGAGEAKLPGRYDLVTIFEALHDMNHPVEALKSARDSLADGGAVLVADERVADRFTAPGDEIERFDYGFSVLHCLPVANLEEDSAATGTVIRSDTVRAYATQAGFANVEVLPIDHDFWRFYRLTD